MNHFLTIMAAGTVAFVSGTAVFAQDTVDFSKMTCQEFAALDINGRDEALEAIRMAGATETMGADDANSDGTASQTGASDGAAVSPDDAGQGSDDTGTDGTPSVSAPSTGEAPTPEEAGQGSDTDVDGTPSVSEPLSPEKQKAELMDRAMNGCDGNPNMFVMDVANSSLN